MSKIGTGTLKYAVILVFTWCFLELALNILVSIGWIAKTESSEAYSPNKVLYPYFSQPCAQFDTVRGFRWAPSGCRTVKTAFGKTIYDTEVKANEQGYITDRNFVYPEDDSLNILLLGDSYLDAYFLDEPWSFRTEHCLNARGGRFRVYPYGVNGGGVVNWARIWKYDIKQHADQVDMVVISIYGNDLDRDFFAMEHTADSAYISWLPTNGIVQDAELTGGLAVIRSEEFLDDITREHRWSLYLVRVIKARIAEYRFRKSTNTLMRPYYNKFIYTDDQIVSELSLANKYGEKYHMLVDMILDMRSDGIDVAICSVPELKGSIYNQKGSLTQIQKELSFISKLLEVEYWDIYTDFSKFSRKDLSSCYLEYDGHFTQIGSDRYGDIVCDYLFR